MVILAAEDVGLADPQALSVASAAQQAVHFVGLPEGYLILAEAALYLALAPKSNTALTSYQAALADVRERGQLPVPLHLRNAVTGLMKSLGYGAGYQYAHDRPGQRRARPGPPARRAGGPSLLRARLRGGRGGAGRALAPARPAVAAGVARARGSGPAASAGAAS